MKKIFIILLFGILLVGAGFFILKKDTTQDTDILKPTSQIVETAQGKIIKEYIPNEKLLRLRNIETKSEILSAKLNTPQIYQVGLGYQKVAQFTINSKQDYNSVLDAFELYDKKNNDALIERKIDIKYLTTQQVEENVYDKGKCSLSVNGTQTCEQVIIGTQLVEREVWLPFDNSIKTNEKIVIGLFTDVQVEDRVEWIPTIAGVRIREWAVWTSGAVITYVIDDGTNYTVLTYLNNGTFNITLSINASVLVIAGGGGGGRGGDGQSNRGGSGGGGAGGYIYNSSFIISSGNYTVVVGSGGAGGTSPTKGQNSTFSTLNANGGGVGGTYPTDSAGAGGSGGGGAGSTVAALPGGAGTSGQGNSGGDGVLLADPDGAGGGGSGSSGNSPSGGNAGNGGTGTANSINGTSFTYTCGGGGSIWEAGSDGAGGCSSAGSGNSLGAGGSGINNTGSGGGAGDTTIGGGGGGSGKVVIRYTEGLLISPILPEDDANLTTNTITFSVNVLDSFLIGIQNVSLIINESIVETNTSGFEGIYNFSEFVPDGDHNWTVIAYDDADVSYETGTRDFTIDTTSPEVILLAPPLIIDFHLINTNLSINWSANDTHIDTCILQFEGVNNTVTCSDNQTEINITNSINRSLIFYVNDTFGYMTSISRSWDYTVFENSQTFNNETFEGIVNPFTANVTIIESNSITIANLIYNGTSYSNSFSQSGNESILTIDFLIPNVDTDTNLTFFWSLTLLDGQIINLTSHNQTVIILSLDDCSVNTVVLYNYTVVDEGNQSLLSNTTTELNINLLDITRQNYIVNFSKKYSKINPFAVCINKNLSSSTYAVDSIVKYEATGYVIEYYNIVNAIITNTTIPVEITLYDLFSADATEFKITFKAEDFTFVENALIYIDRQYIAENNTFKTVELPKTDSNGQTVGHFVRNDVVYNIRVVKGGEVLGNFKNIIAFCEDYTIGACQMILEAVPEDLIIFEYDEQLGIIFQTLPTYNEDASSISFDFSTNDGSIKTVSMDVTRDDIFGNRSICNNTLTSSSGTLVCSFDPNIDDSVLRVNIAVDGQPIVLSSVRLESPDYGNLGYVLWFFLTFLFVLLFGHSKTEVLIGLAISFIGAISLGITRGDIIGLGSAGIWVLLIIILGIIKLNKDKPQ